MNDIDARTKEWMNKRMNEWMNEWMKEWMNEWIIERLTEEKKPNQWMKKLKRKKGFIKCKPHGWV